MTHSLRWLVAGLAVLALGSVAGATGDSRALNGHDLACQIDWRWAGCRHGGYYPIRIRVLNKGPSRRLTFRFVPDSNLPTVERTIDLAQNGSDQFTLSVPMVANGFDGFVDVQLGGRTLSKMNVPVNLSQRETDITRPSMLVVGPRSTDPSAFEAGVSQLVYGGPTGGFSPHSHMGFGAGEDHEIVSAGDLPTKWIDYTGLDMLTVPLDFFENPDEDRRDVIDAILRWVDTGGTLVVHQLDEVPMDSAELRKALHLDDRSIIGADWKNLLPDMVNQQLPSVRPGIERNTDLITRYLIALRTNEDEEPRDVAIAVLGEDEPDERVVDKLLEVARRTKGWERQWSTKWAETGTIPHLRDVGYGRVVAITGDAFSGSQMDWFHVLRHASTSHSLLGDSTTTLTWPERHGVQPRGQANDFERFLIAGVRSVPVVSFLVLITLFTIVIGPLNYFLLWRRRRLNLLVLTIPLIAFGTSLVLFAYSTVSHGFSVRSRIRSVTLLDQGNNTAVTTSRVAMFAGMAPSSGLEYSPDTAVYPIWPSYDSFRGAHVDWTNGQALDDGWLRSRTRTQFLLVQHEPARVHVNVHEPEGGTLPVDNNLGSEDIVEFLLVRASDGRYYAGENVPVGKRVHLPRATDEQYGQLRDLLARHPMETRGNATFGRADYYEEHAHVMYDEVYESFVRYEGNVMERIIGRVRGLAGETRQLPENTYVAILSRNPNVDVGVENTRTEEGYHLLYGVYARPGTGAADTNEEAAENE